ncbi:MAG: cold shock domain-containing protein [Chloroflexi bacterium]|nr:cold shock domain-containing protein [Chloroflexota bacterium]
MEEATYDRRGRQPLRYGQVQQPPVSNPKPAHGTITDLAGDKGYGHILPEEATATDQDISFHRADMAGSAPWNMLNYDDLQVGQQVEYDLGKDERSGVPKATNVQSLPTRPADMADDLG